MYFFEKKLQQVIKDFTILLSKNAPKRFSIGSLFYNFVSVITLE